MTSIRRYSQTPFTFAVSTRLEVEVKKRLKKSAISLVVSLALFASMIPSPAHAADPVTFPCGTSGTYTVVDGVLTSHSSCVGDLNIDSSVVEIAESAFEGNTNLAAITIPGSVITIRTNAFAAASATSLTLGEGIIEIQHGAFAQLNNYGNPTLNISIPNSVTTLGDGSFQQNRIGTLVIGNSLTSIPRQAFYSNFGGGVTSVVFGSSVRSIGSSAFFGFRGTILSFPEGLETISSEAFAGAYSLNTVFLPTSLTSIASDSFQYSPSTIVYCGSNPNISNFAFPAPNNAKICGNIVYFEGNGSDDYWADKARQVSSTPVNLTTFGWTKTDSTFVRWTTNADGTGTQYSSGGLFPFTDRITTLYAQWQAIPRVIFRTYQGSGEMEDQLSSVATNLVPNQFSRGCGSDFAGWSTNPNGGPTTYQALFPFTAAETYLYAQWTQGSSPNRVRTDVDWNPVKASSGSSPFNDKVMTMVVNPVTGELFAGGLFTNASGISRADYVAKWDGASWAPLGSNGSGDGALAGGGSNGENGVFDLAFDSLGNLFVTGNFTITGVSRHFAKWNGTSWSSVGTGSEFNRPGRAIAVDSRNHIYLGGQFTNVAGVSTVDYLAKWNGTGWSGVGNSGIDNYVRSIDVGLNDNVYVGTWASNIGGIPKADYIAKWDGAVWSALGGTLSGNGQLRDMPRNITVDSRSGVDIVYVGNLSNYILDVSGEAEYLGHFIKWDGTQWEQGLPDVLISDSYVLDVTLAPGGGLVIGGQFYQTDITYRDGCNTNQRSLVYFDGTNTFALGLDGNSPSIDGHIYSVVFDNDGHLIIGGSFDSASGDSSARRIAISNISFTSNPTPVVSPTPTPSPSPNPTPTPTVSLAPSNQAAEIGTAQKPAPLVQRSIDELVEALKPVIVDIPASPPAGAPVLAEQSALNLITSTANKVLGNSPSLVLVGGEYQPSRIVILDDTIAQVVTPDGGVMSLQAKNGETPNAVDESGRVQMAQSNVVVTQGSGLAPNTEFAVYLFSEPTLLGIGRTNDKGEFFASFAVEKNIPLGDHTLQVNGLLTDGRTSSVSIPVRIVDTAVAAANEEAPPVESPATDVFALFGLALLVLGLSWYWAAIRRRKKEQE